MSYGVAPPKKFGAALRIALVEDDVELRDHVLHPGLSDLGFDVTSLGSAAELYEALATTAFDILVLDVGLPDEDGFDVAAHIRSVSPVGIVMLTGRGGDSDRIRGLKIGADAYVSKPVAIDVLAATLASLSRRLAISSASTRLGGWQLHDGGWFLLAPDGAEIQLTQSERTVLGQLFAAAGEPVDRESLIAELADSADDTGDFDPHRLDMVIHRLRKKTADISRATLPLHAVRGRGYLLAIRPPARQET